MSLEKKLSYASIGLMATAAFADVYLTTNFAEQYGSAGGEWNPIARNMMEYGGIYAGAYSFKALMIPLSLFLAKGAESNHVLHYSAACSTFGALSGFFL